MVCLSVLSFLIRLQILFEWHNEKWLIILKPKNNDLFSFPGFFQNKVDKCAYKMTK